MTQKAVFLGPPLGGCIINYNFIASATPLRLCMVSDLFGHLHLSHNNSCMVRSGAAVVIGEVVFTILSLAPSVRDSIEE